MRLSIIVPIYNVEPYLRRCIDSILAQTYRDFEIILVDDGSTDGCPAICDEYARKDSRVVVIHKENGGLSDARNAGLDVARGEYIGFVDSDDLIHPQMYEILIHSLETARADIAQCGMCCFGEEEQIVYKMLNGEALEITYLNAAELLANYYSDGRYRFNQTACNKVYRRAIFEKLRFPVGKFFEDSYIHVDTMASSGKIAVTAVPMYYYLQRNGSIMHSDYAPRQFLGHLDLCCKNLLFFRDLEYKEQAECAVDDFLSWFSKDKFAVYFRHPEYKKEFREVEQGFRREFWAILKNPKICEMKKLLAVTLIVCPKVAWKIAKKYFPECIYPFMR